MTHRATIYHKGLDIVIKTQFKDYYILSNLFSKKDMEKIYLGLKSKIKDTI